MPCALEYSLQNYSRCWKFLPMLLRRLLQRFKANVEPRKVTTVRWICFQAYCEEIERHGAGFKLDICAEGARLTWNPYVSASGGTLKLISP